MQPAPVPAETRLFIPYQPLTDTAALNIAKEQDNLAQIKLLAEMNKLTVELVKRRSDRNLLSADTPRLIKRLKDLSKQLHNIE